MMAFWLLLASILAHALLPVGSPLARTSGSAFSASTADVSLGASRDEALAEAIVVSRSPDGDGFGPAALLLLAAGLVLGSRFGRRAAPYSACRATAPLAASPRQSFDARAPPRV
ncbi:hypothetical protein [Sphingosinicella sp. BN140058]|uniref:hypothetical protein n=1 Tax=Sphingosinicella sp. BN140058 TaxID=1892855 RepID=UPI0010120562|nr:hypothetical protein [Sphingosinicella sp. BN140058]QAY76039.1 hypothetical protein ETR14_05480 [Sphingosinicella sp. BN140058]